MLPLAASYADNCWVGVRPLVSSSAWWDGKYVKTGFFFFSTVCSLLLHPLLLLLLPHLSTWPLTSLQWRQFKPLEWRVWAKAWVGGLMINIYFFFKKKCRLVNQSAVASATRPTFNSDLIAWMLIIEPSRVFFFFFLHLFLPPSSDLFQPDLLWIAIKWTIHIHNSLIAYYHNITTMEIGKTSPWTFCLFGLTAGLKRLHFKAQHSVELNTNVGMMTSHKHDYVKGILVCA